MAQWIFDEKDVEERDFAVIPEGAHRVRVHDITEKVSRTQKSMLEIVLEVSGYAGKIWDYLVFDDSDETARKRTNNKISQVAQSFGVSPQVVPTNPQALVGKVGGARVKHTQYNGDTKANISYYLGADKTATLPEWKNAGGSVTNSTDSVEEIEDVDF